MNIILLSGGSGKRLWPLSNDIRSKQFIKLFKNKEGKYESMVQRVYRQIQTVSSDAKITITTGKDQKSAILNQLGNSVSICVEPFRRDTFPAIALASAYMSSEKGLSDDDVVIVCPVDPYTDFDYFKCLLKLENIARTQDTNIVLLGVEPTYPSEKYGYIIPQGGSVSVKKVARFYEKPTEALAEEYIKQGALWNSGVFAFRIGYLMNILHKYIPFSTYAQVYEHYEELPKISFDYAVVEKESKISCISFDGSWKDVGTWNTLTEEMSTPTIGNVMLSDDCENVNVINELETPLLAMGVKDMIIAASADGIIVSDKHQSSYIKPYVDKMVQRVMFEEKSWGSFRILNIASHSLINRLSLVAGRSMSYHCHHQRDEIWTVLTGEGTATLGERKRPVTAGSVIQIPAGVNHSMEATTDMEILEVQLGDNILDTDVEKECYKSFSNDLSSNANKMTNLKKA